MFDVKNNASTNSGISPLCVACDWFCTGCAGGCDRGCAETCYLRCVGCTTTCADQCRQGPGWMSGEIKL